MRKSGQERPRRPTARADVDATGRTRGRPHRTDEAGRPRVCSGQVARWSGLCQGPMTWIEGRQYDSAVPSRVVNSTVSATSSQRESRVPRPRSARTPRPAHRRALDQRHPLPPGTTRPPRAPRTTRTRPLSETDLTPTEWSTTETAQQGHHGWELCRGRDTRSSPPGRGRPEVGATSLRAWRGERGRTALRVLCRHLTDPCAHPRHGMRVRSRARAVQQTRHPARGGAPTPSATSARSRVRAR